VQQPSEARSGAAAIESTPSVWPSLRDAKEQKVAKKAAAAQASRSDSSERQVTQPRSLSHHRHTDMSVACHNIPSWLVSGALLAGKMLSAECGVVQGDHCILSHLRPLLTTCHKNELA